MILLSEDEIGASLIAIETATRRFKTGISPEQDGILAAMASAKNKLRREVHDTEPADKFFGNTTAVREHDLQLPEVNTGDLMELNEGVKNKGENEAKLKSDILAFPAKTAEKYLAENKIGAHTGLTFTLGDYWYMDRNGESLIAVNYNKPTKEYLTKNDVLSRIKSLCFILKRQGNVMVDYVTIDQEILIPNGY